MFDSPFHYNYTREDELRFSDQSFFNSTTLVKTIRYIKTKNSIIMNQQKLANKRFLVERQSVKSSFKGGGVSYFIEANGTAKDFDLDFSEASALIEIRCGKNSKNFLNIRQKFSGLFSINFIVEKGSELNVNCFCNCSDSVVNISGVNKGSLNVFSSSLVENKHADFLLDVQNSGSANIVLKSVVLNGGIGVKGFDSLKSKSFGNTRIGVLLVGRNSNASILPAASIDNSEQSFSHSANIERISEEELFYLRTRGLKEVDAEKIIYHGFLQNDLVVRA